MSKYIDADKLKARIRKHLIPTVQDRDYDEWEHGRDAGFIQVISIIDSLLQEQPGPPFLIEMAIVWFNNIAESAKKLSSGNVSHLAPTIVGKAIRCAEFLEKRKQEQPGHMIQWTGHNLKEVIDFMGKIPRFGEWFNSWEEYENYVHTHNDILKLFCEDGSHYEVPVGAWIVKTPDGHNVPSVANYVQKEPAKWSEGEEKDIQEASDYLRDYANNCVQGGNSKLYIQSLADRIESLRLHPHWKPSLGQMNALQVVIEHGLAVPNREAVSAEGYIESLYCDLKDHFSL